MSANLHMISALLGGYRPTLKKEIECKYFFVKKWLLPIIKSSKDCRFWLDFESDKNIRMICNPYISIK